MVMSKYWGRRYNRIRDWCPMYVHACLAVAAFCCKWSSETWYQWQSYPAIIRATGHVVAILINANLVHSSCMLQNTNYFYM